MFNPQEQKKREAEMDDFLSRVEEVESQIKAMKDGKLDPDAVTLEGRRIVDIEAEEAAQKEAEEKRRAVLAAKAARTEEEKKERRIRKAEEERTKWWEHAKYIYAQRDALKTESERKERISGLDYSKWDKWVADPDDPVTKQEAEELERAENEKRDAEFEKLNPDFCSQFKDDLKKRDAIEAERLRKAKKHKDDGNDAFRRRQFEDALRFYHKSLKLTPFELPVLTNLAQAHLKQGEYELAVEFANRALFVDPKSVKALFRRAAAKRDQAAFEEAVADLEAAVEIEPTNKDLTRELNRTRIARDEAAKEKEGVDPHVLLRTTGKFEEVCASVRGAFGDTAGTAKGESGAAAETTEAGSGAGSGAGSAAVVPFTTPADHRRALLTIADACANPKNRQILVSSSTLSSVLRACCRGAKPSTAGDIHPQILGAALAIVEIVVSHRDAAELRAVCRVPEFLPACLDIADQFVASPSVEVVVTEPAAHACSILQTLASGTMADRPAAVETAIKKLSRPVERLLALVSASVARSVFQERLITSLLMQSAVGALANLAQREELRLCFAARPPGLDGTATTGFVCRALLDLQRVPISGDAAWATVLGSALAALCNACLNQPKVLAAVRDSDAVPVLLSGLEREPAVEDVVAMRSASLLARLAQDPKALELMAVPKTFFRVASLYVSGRWAVTGVQDGLVRVIAAALTTPEHVSMFVEVGGVEAASKMYGDALEAAGGPSNPIPRLPALGNLTRALIVVSQSTAPALQNRMLRAKLPDRLVEVLKRAGDGPVRKNAAVCLARMARHEASRERIRDLRGLEILMQLKDTLM